MKSNDRPQRVYLSQHRSCSINIAACLWRGLPNYRLRSQLPPDEMREVVGVEQDMGITEKWFHKWDAVYCTPSFLLYFHTLNFFLPFTIRLSSGLDWSVHFQEWQETEKIVGLLIDVEGITSVMTLKALESLKISGGREFAKVTVKICEKHSSLPHPAPLSVSLHFPRAWLAPTFFAGSHISVE